MYQRDEFDRICHLLDITPEDILNSLDLQENKDTMFKAGQGAGKSGSFFFFTADNRFIIKSLGDGEKKVILDLQKPLLDYFEANPKSLISKFIGVFSIKCKSFAPVDFVIMENVTSNINPKNMKVTFDLKGSTF